MNDMKHGRGVQLLDEGSRKFEGTFLNDYTDEGKWTEIDDYSVDLSRDEDQVAQQDVMDPEFDLYKNMPPVDDAFTFENVQK